MENNEIMEINEEVMDMNEEYYLDEMEDAEGVSIAEAGIAVAGLAGVGILGYVAGKKLAPTIKRKLANAKANYEDRRAMKAALKEQQKAFVEAWKAKSNPEEPDSEEETEE